MATTQDRTIQPNVDVTAQLAEAIRLLADRVAPKTIDQSAQTAIAGYTAIARDLRTVFSGTPDKLIR